MSKAYVGGLPRSWPQKLKDLRGSGSSANTDAQAIVKEIEAFFTAVLLRRRVLDRRVTKRIPEPLAPVAVTTGDQCQKRRVAVADLSRTVRACYPTRSSRCHSQNTTLQGAISATDHSFSRDRWRFSLYWRKMHEQADCVSDPCPRCASTTAGVYVSPRRRASLLMGQKSLEGESQIGGSHKSGNLRGREFIL